jgi:hypothetical protein
MERCHTFAAEVTITLDETESANVVLSYASGTCGGLHSALVDQNLTIRRRKLK